MMIPPISARDRGDIIAWFELVRGEVVRGNE